MRWDYRASEVQSCGAVSFKEQTRGRRADISLRSQPLCAGSQQRYAKGEHQLSLKRAASTHLAATSALDPSISIRSPL
jgi:hypothetical protein